VAAPRELYDRYDSQSIKQSSNQATDKSANESINQSANRPVALPARFQGRVRQSGSWCRAESRGWNQSGFISADQPQRHPSRLLPSRATSQLPPATAGTLAMPRASLLVSQAQPLIDFAASLAVATAAVAATQQWRTQFVKDCSCEHPNRRGFFRQPSNRKRSSPPTPRRPSSPEPSL
jgi:hypothetical protein